MTMAKIAISLPKETLKKARGEVRRRKTTMSAYIAELLDERVVDRDLQEMIDEMLAETGGPPTAEEERQAEEILGLRPRKRRKR